MASDPFLLERLRQVLHERHVTWAEKSMYGGECFMVDDKMCFGTYQVLVQEFIKEALGVDIRAFVIDGKVVDAMKRPGPEGEFRSNLHRGGLGTVVKLSVEEELSAIRASEVLGLKIAGVDMLRSSRGPMILEVNSSLGLKGIEQATGLDIAGKIIAFVAAQANNKEVADKIGF